MKQAATAVAIVVPIALLALAVLNARASRDTVVDACAEAAEWVQAQPGRVGDWIDETGTCRGLDGEPCETTDAPIEAQEVYRMAGQHTVTCPQVDAGTTIELMRPDGGVLVQASTYYVAPVVGAAVKVRIGGDGVTPSTGFEIGPSARDGVGVSLDMKDGRCVSTGNAQAVDVVYGRQ